MQEKHCDDCPFTGNMPIFMKEDGALCFRLLCMLLPQSIPSGVRFVPWKSLMVFTRSFNGDWRCLCENGHEHISLMPFLIVELSPIGDLG